MKRKLINKKIVAIFTMSFGLIGLLAFEKYPVYAENLSAPKSLEAISQSITNDKVTLIWQKPDNYDNIANYNIYENGKKIGDANSGERVAKEYVDRFYNEDSDSDTVKISIHNYTVKNLNPDTQYKFAVRSVDNKGNESSSSETVVVKTISKPKVFNVEDYGAKGDGSTINTEAIQKAINECTTGSTVLIPSGKTFKTGSITLRSDMTFDVEGTLLGSENPDDYPYPDTSKVTKSSPLINAKSKSSNIRIVGLGTIDGNGWKKNDSSKDSYGLPVYNASKAETVLNNGILAAAQYKKAVEKYGFSSKDAYSTRSNLIEMSGVSNLYVGDGLTLRNPAQHTESNSGGSNIVINGLKLETYDCNNGDGTGIGNGQNLIVVDSVIDTGDDDVAFNAGKGAAAAKNNPTSNIWIFDNYFGHGHGAVACGSATAAWIQNILAEDNVLNGTGTGLRCKSSKGNGGGVRNVVFRDTAMKNINDNGGQPFIFTSQYNGDLPKDPANEPMFKNIEVKNCSVNGAKSNAIVIEGLEGSCHNNINFTNVTFKGTQAAKIDYAENCIFKNVKFDDSIKDPWVITNSKNLLFEGTTTTNS